MYTISKRYTFEAAHHINTLPEGHKCKRPHGHSYTAEFKVMCNVLNRHGFVMDFGEMDIAIKPIIDQLDHHDLNEVFDNVPMTSEFLAGWLFFEVDHRINGGSGIIYDPSDDPDLMRFDQFTADTAAYVAHIRAAVQKPRYATPRLMSVRVSETDKTYAEYTR